MSSASTKRQISAHKSSAKAHALAVPPRDWLGQVASEKGIPAKALASVRGWMEEQFIGDEFAQLGHAGHGETRIALRRVFVDLPMTTQPGGLVGPGQPTTPFLGDLLAFTPQPLNVLCGGLLERDVFLRLDPIGIEREQFGRVPSEKNTGGPERRRRRAKGNGDASIAGRGAAGGILIGGPGQGKSTLCQLLCQLHRAALLRGDPALRTTVRDVLTPFEEHESKSTIYLPTEPLFPIRIVLPDASTWMARSKTEGDTPEALPVLLSFLASQESAKTAKCNAETFATWLRSMPFLLLLDGFDEIGAEEDRKRIVAAIRSLVTMLAKQEAKGIIVATTRPQGYTGELNGIGIPLATRYLAQLSTEQALAYASKLLKAKISGVDERQKVENNLREAAKEPGISRLLQTPLQVTILAGLVENARPPSERWKLFESYLNLVYAREAERSISAKELLTTRRTQILSIHARAALLLQVEAEAAGGAASRMSRQRFEAIVAQVLEEEGLENEELTELVTRIVKVAENRLVFLVEPEPGFFGFEIRSIQEFMAAWALVQDVPEARAEARILQIAKAPLFRNVLLFIASKIFGSTSALRDYLAKSVCSRIDEDASDALAQTTKAGAWLALEMLEEGAVLPSPKFARDLMRQAVGLLDLPPAEIHVRLVRAANKDTEKDLINAIEARLTKAGDDGSDALRSWICLVEGANVGQTWAAKIAEERWPSLRKPNDLLEACRIYGVRASDWLVAKVNEEPEKFDPWSLAMASLLSWKTHVTTIDRSKLVDPVGSVVGSIGEMVHSPRQWDFRFVRIAAAIGKKTIPPSSIDGVRVLSNAWRAWVGVLVFHESPSAAQLAATLDEFAAYLAPHEWRGMARWSSWPLQACLRTASTREQLQEIADACRNLELGDCTEWYEAEKNWRQLGAIANREALRNAPVDLPFTKESIRTGVPVACMDGDYGDWFSRRPMYASMDQWLRVRKAVSDCAPMVDNSGAIELMRAYIEDVTNPAWLEQLAWRVWMVRARALPHTLRVQLKEALSTPYHDAPEIRLLVSVLRMWIGVLNLPEIHALLQHLALGVDRVDGPRINTARTIISANFDEPTRESVLLHWYQLVRGSFWEAGQTVKCMLDVLQTRRSGLDNAAIWDKLDLPKPYPQGAASALHDTLIPARPIVLQKVHIEHVRGIQNVEIEFTPPEAGKGQWVVLLGTNGSGKTTLLRSLCLALRNLNDLKIWPNGMWNTTWRSFGQKIDPHIRVTVDGMGEHSTRLKNGAEKPEQAPTQTQPWLFPVFAYGCRRGSAVGGETRPFNLRSDDGPEIGTLFDESARLVHAETWLKEWDADAVKVPERSKPIYEALQQALRDLLDVKDVFVKDREVYIEEKNARMIPFAALSDGYLTMAGWFIDLLARWIELCHRAKQDVRGDFMKTMRGLVLLDEIDLHLHPKWQVESIRRVKRLLPEMSFVVTTHNPLTLVGAIPDEIHILKVRDHKIVAERGRDRPMLLSSGEIFTQYFEVDDIFPAAIGRDLQRYGFLSSYSLRTPEEEKELYELKAKLASDGIAPSWEIVPQMGPTTPTEDVVPVKPTRRRKSP